VPPHLEDPSGSVAVWYTDPPGVVMQFVQAARGDLTLVRWLVGPARERLLERFPGSSPLVFVMDLGLMTGRDAAVRPILNEAAKALRPRIARSVVVPPENASAIYMASLHASVSLLRVFGVPVEIQPLSTALRSLRAAPPG
jgi:hypothetical protein